MSTRSFDPYRPAALCFLVLTLAYLSLPDSASSQVPSQHVRVTRGANVHQGPATQRVILFLVPQGTVLPVIERVGRDGVWIAVELTPEVRKRGTRIRWRNEDRGYVHQSTVEFIDVESSP